MSRRLTLIVAAALLSLLAASGAVVASEPEIDPDTTVSIENSDPGLELPGATPIQPDPTITDPRPHAWDHIAVSSDGMTLSIYFWMVIEDCNGLHSVTVSSTDSGIDVQLATGIPAGAEDMACIELAQLYVTTVTLEEPLISGAVG